MKTMIAIITAMMIIAMCGIASADMYPQTAQVVEVDYSTDTVTVETFTGFLFTFTGCDDWSIGECASLIMEDNGTELIYDDKIIMAQYSAWGLYNWYQ